MSLASSHLRSRTRFGAGLLLATLMCAPVGAHEYRPFGRHSGRDDAAVLAHCPRAGDARWPPARMLNALKRRMRTPTARDIDPHVTLAAMLAPGDDTHRWSDQRGAVIVGYVAAVRVGGVESVNCHTHEARYRDTHIEMTLEPLHDSPSRRVIVEVTPQWRERLARQGIDWSTPALRRALLGRWVRVTGWLLFDFEHENAAANTATDPDARIWRATAWEIHPVTRITVLRGRRH